MNELEGIRSRYSSKNTTERELYNLLKLSGTEGKHCSQQNGFILTISLDRMWTTPAVYKSCLPLCLIIWVEYTESALYSVYIIYGCLTQQARACVEATPHVCNVVRSCRCPCRFRPGLLSTLQNYWAVIVTTWLLKSACHNVLQKHTLCRCGMWVMDFIIHKPLVTLLLLLTCIGKHRANFGNKAAPIINDFSVSWCCVRFFWDDMNKYLPLSHRNPTVDQYNGGN